MHVPNEALLAYAVKPFYRGKKVTVISAISFKRVVALMTLDNSMNIQAFEVFIEKCWGGDNQPETQRW